MSQSHGSSLWREPVGSGAVPGAVPVFFVADGSDVVPSLIGPAQFQFIDAEQDGGGVLLNLSPVYLVNDGSGNAVPSNTGPSVFVLADGGSGDIEATNDLTRAPVADLLYDQSGDLWLVRRSCTRLDAVQVRGDIVVY